jgi:hypothetical protein
VHGDTDEHIFWAFFRILYEHVEVSVISEDASIEQFVFEILACAVPVGLDQVQVGKLALRVLF